ncbi:MAG: N-acetylneuraminate synthase family protein [Bacteroidota bacterium]
MKFELNRFINIDNRRVGKDYRPLVIAEIGINHEGSLAVAKQMVDAAYSAGVEVIKHQTHIVDDEMSSAAKKVIPGNAEISIYDIMERCALSEADEFILKKYVEAKGMIFMSTPFGKEAADRLMDFGVKAFKIGSGECNNYPLIEHISNFGKPVILSTGMNDISTVAPAVDILRNLDIQYALLHTTNLYPTPNKLVRLGALEELENQFDCVVGLSDHTVSNHACFGAVALGASILERHFTDRMDRKGPDIVCSMDAAACRDLIEGSEILYEQRGGSKNYLEEEQVTRNFAFATVSAIKDISVGEQLTRTNIWVKRPGTGEIKADKFNEVLGKRVNREIKNGEQLRYQDIVS